MRLLIFCLSVITLWSDVAILAGGCFWCLEHDLKKVPGVESAISGYIGGKKPNPTYEEVSSGTTGYVEAVKVEFDPSILPYTKLLDIYWHNIDPTRDDGQFCDSGPQYRPVVFTLTPTQHEEAVAYKKAFPIQPNKVQILPATTFYPAEEYHQNYAEKNPVRYRYYRFTCGRDKRLKQLYKRS